MTDHELNDDKINLNITINNAKEVIQKLYREYKQMSNDIEKKKLKNKIKEIINEAGVLQLKFGDNEKYKLLTRMSGKLLPRELMKVLNIITINDYEISLKTPPIVGSSAFRSIKYGGDIDLYEIVLLQANDEENAINKIIGFLKQMANRVEMNKILVSDIKVGIDQEIYKLVEYLGNIDDKAFGQVDCFFGVIDGYKRDLFISHLNYLLENNIIDEKYNNYLLEIISKTTTMSGYVYSKLYSLLRKKFILRWTLNDIKNGFKDILNANGTFRRVNLSDALKHDTIVKIDFWNDAPDNRMKEVTVIYNFIWKKNAKGKQNIIGYEFTNYVGAIKNDIIYYSDPSVGKNTKLLKRMFNFCTYYTLNARNEKNNIIIDPTQFYILLKIFEELNKDVWILNKFKADLELLEMALDEEKIVQMQLSDKYKAVYYSLLKNIRVIPSALSSTLYLGKTQEEYEELYIKISDSCNQIIDGIEKICNMNIDVIENDIFAKNILLNENNRILLIDKVSQLFNMMEGILDEVSLNFLLKNNLHPRQKDSFFRIDYSFNYLNMEPPITN